MSHRSGYVGWRPVTGEAQKAQEARGQLGTEPRPAASDRQAAYSSQGSRIGQT